MTRLGSPCYEWVLCSLFLVVATTERSILFVSIHTPTLFDIVPYGVFFAYPCLLHFAGRTIEHLRSVLSSSGCSFQHGTWNRTILMDNERDLPTWTCDWLHAHNTTLEIMALLLLIDEWMKILEQQHYTFLKVPTLPNENENLYEPEPGPEH